VKTKKRWDERRGDELIIYPWRNVTVMACGSNLPTQYVEINLAIKKINGFIFTLISGIIIQGKDGNQRNFFGSR
jgi:hypothetical protein